MRAFTANCPETDCPWTFAEEDRAHVADALAGHLRDRHGREEPRGLVERRVMPVPPPSPGTPGRQLP